MIRIIDPIHDETLFQLNKKENYIYGYEPFFYQSWNYARNIFINELIETEFMEKVEDKGAYILSSIGKQYVEGKGW